MHTCPECGQACVCHGDIDDCLMDTEDTYIDCVHPCEPLDEDESFGDFDADYDALEPRCRVCGCSAFHPCAGGCIWAEADLCSRCVSVPTDAGGAG